MDRKQTEARIGELRVERATVEAALSDARATARLALIEGKKPTGRLAELSERVELIDGAIADLAERLTGIDDREARRQRTIAIEKAQAQTAERRALAARVDETLAALADAWRAYVDGVRATVGNAIQAGADTVPLARVALNGGPSDALVKALIAATGNMDTVRALAISTNNRVTHGVALASAEDRVLRSLEAELLRVKAGSPQRHVAREAQQQLEQMEKEEN